MFLASTDLDLLLLLLIFSLDRDLRLDLDLPLDLLLGDLDLFLGDLGLFLGDLDLLLSDLVVPPFSGSFGPTIVLVKQQCNQWMEFPGEQFLGNYFELEPVIDVSPQQRIEEFRTTSVASSPQLNNKKSISQKIREDSLVSVQLQGKAKSLQWLPLFIVRRMVANVSSKTRYELNDPCTRR